MGSLAVTIDGSAVLGTGIKKRQVDPRRAGIVAGSASHIPGVTTLLLSGCSYVFPDLSLGEYGLLPIGRTVTDELERSGVGLVVLDLVRCHLQRRIEDHEECQLLGQGGVDMSLRHHRVFKPECHRSEIHRSCQTACEGEGHGMRRRIPPFRTPCIPFLTTYTLLSHQVGISTLQTCRHHGLVVVDGQTVPSRCLDHLAVVTHTKLAAVQFLIVEHVADIAGLDVFHAVIGIEPHAGLHLVFIVRDAASGLVMADERNSLFPAIAV